MSSALPVERRFAGLVSILASVAATAALVAPFADSQAHAADRPGMVAAPPVTGYADLADLADAAALVARVQVRKTAEVEPERARGLRSGWARLYVEARTEAVLGGRTALGEAVRYLVDVPRDAKGKVAKLNKRSVILFARPVPSRPGELQLVAPDAQVAWDAPTEAQVRAILAELYAPGAVQKVTGLREVIHVPGALSGESETQMFLATANGEPAAITVSRIPDQPARWSVSFSELVDTSAPPPAAQTLAWYRLACSLPRQLPANAIRAGSAADASAAAEDYAFVLGQLGPCGRLRR